MSASATPTPTPTVFDETADSAVSAVSAVDSAPTHSPKTTVFVVTSLARKYKDFAYVLGLLGYEVVMVDPGKVDELASHDSFKLINDKMHRLKEIVGKLPGFVIYEDTKFNFVKNGTDLGWPSFGVTGLASKTLERNLSEWAGFLGAQEGKYSCGAILEIPDGRTFFFSATRNVTMCDERSGEGAIDRYTIPKGSVKAFSEMSDEERTGTDPWAHARAVIAREIALKLQELGY